MAIKHELRVSAQYSSEGEYWKVEVLDAGSVIASAERLPNSAKAREAGEYLSFAISDDWQLLHAPSDQAISAGVEAVKSDIETEVAQDPASDGFMHPGRLLRKIFRTIRLEQAIELHRDDGHAVEAATYVSGWHWALRMGREVEPPKSSGEISVGEVSEALRLAIWGKLECDDLSGLNWHESNEVDVRIGEWELSLDIEAQSIYEITCATAPDGRRSSFSTRTRASCIDRFILREEQEALCARLGRAVPRS